MSFTNSKVSWRLTKSSLGFCLDHLLVRMLFGVAFYTFKASSILMTLGIIIYLKVYLHICSPVCLGNSLFQIVHSSVKTEELVTLNQAFHSCILDILLHLRFRGISIYF